jgi:hypothetical protein
MIIPQIVAVEPRPDYSLVLEYQSGEKRMYSMKPWIGRGMFGPLSDPSYFSQVRFFRNTVEWPNGADLDPQTLFEDSIPVI